MSGREFYRAVSSQDNPADGPHGWVQWKGTDVCIDLHCKCGFHGHYDGDFLYFWECPICHAKYALGCNVKLIELTKDQSDYVESDHIGFKTSDIDEDEE
jgi:hypothetical protein